MVSCNVFSIVKHLPECPDEVPAIPSYVPALDVALGARFDMALRLSQCARGPAGRTRRTQRHWRRQRARPARAFVTSADDFEPRPSSMFAPIRSGRSRRVARLLPESRSFLCLGAARAVVRSATRVAARILFMLESIGSSCTVVKTPRFATRGRPSRCLPRPQWSRAGGPLRPWSA